jgi:EAL domain-containing protein (putative c-di-GMP-specific phosphodiesterase class I)
MYAAKSQGPNSHSIYSPNLAGKGREKIEIESALHKAIERDELVLHYQPKVDARGVSMVGVEALMRWRRNGALVPPAEFIPLAEACGEIGALTLAVLRRACLDARDFDLDLRLSINVAAAQIEDGTLADQLLAVLHETGFDPRRLEIELTENALVRDIGSARRVIAMLKAAGMTIALDDFGTGYSSLAYLSELPFDKLKIDRSFVRTLHERAESAKIVAAIIGLSRSLGVEVVAEGVETERDAEVLSRLGCGSAQGFLFARPMSAAAMVRGRSSGRAGMRVA